ncbi:transketolase [Candidatus Uhrbacteria bacterium RIFCSPLOWO2_01_FULL_47_24]|uniref:Transketolase n=1 Tax=Candidatus Uhrbacteria bacterium RIFCSPLOWO2_01_FULL_47_24 TaxID=1802401 RepID=A0A1F7URZ1_9BACT|nr:MAG: transketolase [Candidatus Uhrbacteria bacterium RIFCSPHIGHO2_01_FULL_47_11]OGL67714.1 MAG: transketolase [Candidatus Uhrbacteria bacterium RIFCSPHIGHO2_02_FULL_46_47]OGL76560.1 MAG: transketolase [Candidatus Uhrbacteria bacterium RIFCSPHIGHO2_12_FULL_47_11]OGL81005.1 MAG: transketolase [Candidatus Uhrbacteria bacterium RIFCSPLOWO2_01_FULL_47_24]OGL84307.1 MAG: transketolase [Candidatus Uhrbacteria bacterium RIFCSPLOWO2_02_FULL_46_25]OGL92109.1 MAG: transketolase [Candidatus Uhrbacteria
MPHIHDEKVKELEEKALKVRELIIEMLLEAKSGHSAGPLGMADIFVALYFHILHHDPKNPEWPDRDRLILSNGHICPVRYATMALAGYFPIEELKTLRKFGTRLQGHPERLRLPGVETTSGPLGSGLGQAAGLAYGARMDGKKWRTYCAMSDAEQAAGVCYEAMLFAGRNKLSNLTGIIDRNNIQIDGNTEDIMPLEPLRAKYEANNWHVIEANGNDMRQFINAVEEAKTIYEKPTVIIAHTIPGRGVSFMEKKFEWHGIPPNKEQAAQALLELRTLQGKITSEHE